MLKKRLFNLRPMCFFAAFLTLGILTVELLFNCNNLYRLIPLLLAVSAVAGFSFFKRSRKFVYLAVAFLVGVLSMSGANDVYASRMIAEKDAVTFQGTVASEIVVENGEGSFYVADAVINGTTLDGRTYVKTDFAIVPDFGAGDVVQIVGSLNNFEHNRFDSYYAWSAGKKIYYISNATNVSKLSKGKPDFPLNLQLEIKQMFYDNTSADTASICQALILGDKRGMDDQLYDEVKNSGLAHVFAVSGLHITALATALYWLLKKSKVNQKLSFLIVLILTFLYAMLCSFTPSVLRAFIMTAVLNFANAFGLKRDGLSSLAFASIILLLINPVSIMDVGFLLSVFSMLGLMLFYRPINDFLMRVVNKISPEKHIGKVLVGSISTSLSANVITYPMVGYFFGSIPILFVVSSLIILPYLMFIWLILLFITAFALITTLWGMVGLMDYLLIPFVGWLKLIGNISWASLNVEVVSIVGALLLVYWVFVCLLLSRFVFLSRRSKVVSLSVWSGVCTIVCLVSLAALHLL